MSLKNLDWWKHTHIGLDLDETLAKSMEKALAEIHKKWKLLFCKDLDGFSHFNIEEIPGCDMNMDEIRTFWEEQTLENCDSIKDAEIGVELLNDQNKKLSIITARSDEKYSEDVYIWLEKYFTHIPRENIFFANHKKKWSRKKSEICREIWVTLMIDDGIHNAEDLVENNIPCILLEKPWNRNSDFSHPLLCKVKDWSEIIESLKKYE